jgi:general secretion pathway protein L
MSSGVWTAFQAFLRWWGDELKALLPDRALAGKGRSGARLVLSVEAGRKRLIRESGASAQTIAEVAGADAGLSSLIDTARRYSRLPMVLRFGSRDCFARTLELPAQANDDFGRILILDMERTTPFCSGEVLTAHYPVAGASAGRGKRLVRHLVIKRKTIEPILNQLTALGIVPACADCWDEEQRAGLPVNFLAPLDRSGKRSGARFIPAMAGLVLVLMASAAAILVVRHQTALDGLNAQIAEARAEAAAVRLAAEASQTVAGRIATLERLVNRRAPVAGIIDEITRLLPDTAWVSDLRMEGDVIEFTGFALAVASLVPILEKSSSFSVRLRLSRGAPVTQEPDADARPEGSAAL